MAIFNSKLLVYQRVTMGMFNISGSGLYLGSQTSQGHLAKLIVSSMIPNKLVIFPTANIVLVDGFLSH